jgi:glucan phosphoethanolaminetransferase (alkaline phosphatase superfamily)
MWRKFSLAAYVLAWLSPALCYLVSDFRLESIAKVLVTLVFFCLWHGSFSGLRRALHCSLFFFLILLPFDLFFFYIYGEPPGTPVFLSIGDSNLIEAADFMRGRFSILLTVLLLSAATWTLAARAVQHDTGTGWRYYNRHASMVARSLLGGFFAVTVLFAVGPGVERLLGDTGYGRVAASIKAADEKVLAPLANLRPIFPVGRFVSMAEFYRESTYVRIAGQSRHLFTYHARQVNAPAARQVYILVVGETARADRFSLNGYSRGLPSFLAQTENIVPLRDIVSPFTYSNLSVPAMLTPPVPQANGGRDSARSLVSAFREAGFKTYWISNQQPIGMRESEISHFSHEADESVFLNWSIRTMHKDGLYDEHLIGPLAKFLARNEPKQFFVLHMLGAHDSYQRRYPPAFDIFQPSLRSLDNPDHHDRRNKLAVENSYDNAMRYTEYVLARIIATVARQDAISALVYSGDHGETLFDDECQRTGHGSSGKQEFPVAAMAWVSNKYKAAWPERFARLKKNESAPITTEAILPTMLDLASLETPWLDRPSSLASASFQIRPRWVHAPEPVDWDTATTRGLCHLLVASKPKGKHQALAASTRGTPAQASR